MKAKLERNLGGKAKKIMSKLFKNCLIDQARSITGMYSSTLIHPLLCEAGLILASTFLNYRQTQFAYRPLSLRDQHAKNILPISLRKWDASYQPGEPPENTLMWTKNARPTLYGHWLAWQIRIEHSKTRQMESSQ